QADRRHGRRRVRLRPAPGRGPPEEEIRRQIRPLIPSPKKASRKANMMRSSIAALGSTLLLAALATPVHAQGNLTNPAALNEKAPATYKARFDTSKGVFVIDVKRDYAPNGADRFYNLVKNGFFDDTRFFRVISGFMVQFGISGDPKISAPWREARINDDPV